MKLTIFGKRGCSACKQAKAKIEYYLTKWQADVPLEYCDMETVDGLALGAFHDVSEVPTVLLEKGGKELRRWVKFPPLSEELKGFIGQNANVSNDSE